MKAVKCDMRRIRIEIMFGKLEANADCPNVLRSQWSLLASNATCFQIRRSTRMTGRFAVSVSDSLMRSLV